ncbi:hypothetical protein MtrunA17_Chr2g0324761 [Medicago truncatula]|uniref:Uncharacterized protein n=1 Tax=Medicago truncatula TaxID=3880 RepID=A0A396JGC5_MEDTR|nr:hypothetical protein MtrunA17_Chr2g0324761 [Medicago truncatula]
MKLIKLDYFDNKSRYPIKKAYTRVTTKINLSNQLGFIQRVNIC